MHDPFQGLFCYLISGFAMFVLGEPGHLIGMPFWADLRCGMMARAGVLSR
ncbi:MAG TPA: DUF2115 family protein [Methanocella sp.]|nr:DUF2115 family protein [Methanocella sp.]